MRNWLQIWQDDADQAGHLLPQTLFSCIVVTAKAADYRFTMRVMRIAILDLAVSISVGTLSGLPLELPITGSRRFSAAALLPRRNISRFCATRLASSPAPG